MRSEIWLGTLCVASGLPAPQLEYRFAPPRRFRFDLAWPDRMLAVEIEGGVYLQGRHQRPAGFQRDMTKYNLATLMGWRLLRVTPAMVNNGEALGLIQEALRNDCPA